jgi:predicted DNA-binding ribbon-helix-helix protein
MFTKHSIQIGGRSISISMEEEFWECLREIAANRNTTLSHLITEIADKVSGSADGRTLASILRVYVLEEIMQEAKSAKVSGYRFRRSY